jgi:TonB family protein
MDIGVSRSALLFINIDMRLHDIIPNDPLLEDLSRRGFLKGIAGAAASSATGAMAAPFRHGSHTDQMTGKEEGKFSTVVSDNSNAKLIIQWPGHSSPGVVITVPGKVINYKTGRFGSGAGARIKIGNLPVEDISIYSPDSGNYSKAFLGFDNANRARIARQILKSSGPLKIELPIFREGNVVFAFTIEPDEIVKQIKDPIKKKTNKPDAEPGTDDQTSLRQNNLDRMQQAEPSAAYIARVKSRIGVNISNNPELRRFGEEGKVTVEIKMDKDGDILSQRIVQSSGFKRVDDAVITAIQRTQVLPRDTDGRVPPTLKLNFEITSSSTN